MGVYIKGMEMPECCDKCPFKSYVGVDHLECKITGYRFYVWEVGWGDKPYTRHESCPLTEIPPHGPLIDMDDFLQECSELESYRTAMALCEVIEAEPPESCGDCNHYCTGQFFNNEEICMVTGDNAPYDISDCPLRKKEEGRE